VDPDWTATTFAWNDVARGVYDGALSCWGRNITDVQMGSDTPGKIPFVRPQNMDETVGVTTSDKIVLHDGTTLHDYLCELTMDKAAVRNAGFTSFDTGLQKTEPVPVLARVQYSWVPLAHCTASRNVAPMHYSYQTLDPKQPANVVITDTRCGTFLTSDDVGQKKLFAHDEQGGEHWHVASATSTAVGNGVNRAAGTAMGLKGMTPHENVFLVISLPRKQPPGDLNCSPVGGGPVVYRSLASDGISSAARLSVDSDVVGTRARHDIAFERDTSQEIWVTIMLFNTVAPSPEAHAAPAGFIPSAEDVRNCVEEGKRIYGLCDHVAKLSCIKEALHKLTTQDMVTIKTKLEKDPPCSPSKARKIVPDPDALAAFA
jgi:hypothetical protein